MDTFIISKEEAQKRDRADKRRKRHRGRGTEERHSRGKKEEAQKRDRAQGRGTEARQSRDI